MSFVLSAPELSDAEFASWQHLLEEKTGISFEKHKSILQTGLNQRMREVGCEDYATYYGQVCDGKAGKLEWESLLRTLTIKETRFFRDPASFSCVKRYLFEKLVEAKDESSIELWSVACSTGEEAYSLAMVASDCIEGLGSERLFGVTATDICRASLNTARAGRYQAAKLEHVDVSLKERYFEQSATDLLVSDAIRGRVCFVGANIIELDQFPAAPMDVIFCQNVLIYFKQWRQCEVLDTLADRLKPGGIMVIGSGESVGWNNPKVTRYKDGHVNAYIKHQ